MVFFEGKRKKNNYKKKIIALGGIIILFTWFYYLYSVKVPVSTKEVVQEFVVESGWGSTRISHELKAVGLIRNAYVFQMHVWTMGIDSRLLDGTYNLSPSLNIKEISQILHRGPGDTLETSLTFVEGWKNSDYAKYLEEKGVTTSKDFFDVIQKKASWWDEYDFLNDKPKNLDLEGYLFPDTYRVFTDSSTTTIVRKMLDNFDKKLTPQMRADIKKQGKTIHEVLTMASILEKEVRTLESRKMVADIFYKRLDVGIALGSDATVNYAVGKSNTRSTATDLEIDSPYNTYKYRGLPPGPIANPGLSAIEAAIYPTKNNYYYFLTTPDGEVIYNVDFDGHVEDKNKHY